MHVEGGDEKERKYKRKDSIKGEGVSEKGDRKNQERNTVAIENQTYNVT